MSVEHFNLPTPPQGLVFPDEQGFVTTLMWVIVAGFALYALWDGIRSRSPLAPLLFIGGFITYFNEPMVDVLGLCWHPRIHQWVALETFGPAPMWGLGVYAIFYGGMTHVMLRQAERGISRRTLAIGVLIWFLLDLAAELPLIHLGFYHYYGEPPMQLAGLPLYWLFINVPGPLMGVALLLRAPHLFRGWRLALVPLLPMTTDAVGSVASGWPIFSGLNTPNASMELKYFAACLTILIGIVIFDAVSKVICTPTKP